MAEKRCWWATPLPRLSTSPSTPEPSRVSVDLRGKVAADGAFDGTARFELAGIAGLVLRRAFLDSSDAEKEKTLSDFTGDEFQGASVRHVESGDPAELTKPFWVKFELHKKDFFAPGKTSMQVKLGWNTDSLRGLDGLPKPEKAVPIESGVISTNLDLIVDTAFMITDHMPVHRESPSGKYDSEYQYENGHLLLKRSLSFKAGMLVPAEWASLIDLMKAARDESNGGFTLERRPATNPALAALSPLTRAMQEGSAAYQKRDYEGARKAYLEATRSTPRTARRGTIWVGLMPACMYTLRRKRLTRGRDLKLTRRIYTHTTTWDWFTAP